VVLSHEYHGAIHWEYEMRQPLGLRGPKGPCRSIGAALGVLWSVRNLEVKEQRWGFPAATPGIIGFTFDVNPICRVAAAAKPGFNSQLLHK